MLFSSGKFSEEIQACILISDKSDIAGLMWRLDDPMTHCTECPVLRADRQQLHRVRELISHSQHVPGGAEGHGPGPGALDVELLDLGQLIIGGVKSEDSHQTHPPTADVDPLPVGMEENLGRGSFVHTDHIELIDFGQISSFDVYLE